MAGSPVRELITRVKFQVDNSSFNKVEKQVDKLKKSLDKLSKKYKINVDIKTSNAQKLAQLTAMLHALPKNNKIKVGVNTASINQAVAQIKNQLAHINMHITGTLTNLTMRAHVVNLYGKIVPQGGGGGGHGGGVHGGGGGGRFSAAVGDVAGLYGGYVGVSQIRESADDMMNLDGRLRIVTKDEQERLDVENQLYEMGQKTRQPLMQLGKLYFNVARASEELGYAQKDNLRVTETVSKALVVGGASAGEAAASILQLGQALGSGRLQGDELRSLDENASALMKHVAEYFGTNVAGLKEMGSQGELTSDRFMEAILYASTAVDEEFQRMPMTFGQAMNVMSNSFDKFILGLETKSTVFSTLARGMAKGFEAVGKDFEAIGALTGDKNSAEYQQAAAENPGLAKTVETLQEIATWLDELDGKAGNIDEQIAGWVKLFVEVAAVLAPILAIIAAIDAVIMVLSPIAGLIASIGSALASVWGAITTAGAALMEVWAAIAPLIEMLGAAIAGLSATAIAAILAIIAVIVLCIAYWDELKAFVISVGEAISNAAKAAAAILQSAFGSAIEAVKGFFAGLRDFALGVISDIANAISSWLGEKIAWAKSAIGDLQSFASSVIDGIGFGGGGSDNRSYNQTNNVNVASVGEATSFVNGSTFFAYD